VEKFNFYAVRLRGGLDWDIVWEVLRLILLRIDDVADPYGFIHPLLNGMPEEELNRDEGRLLRMAVGQAIAKSGSFEDNKYLDVLNAFTEAGADVNQRCGSMLWASLVHGRELLTQFLLMNGAKVCVSVVMREMQIAPVVVRELLGSIPADNFVIDEPEKAVEVAALVGDVDFVSRYGHDGVFQALASEERFYPNRVADFLKGTMNISPIMTKREAFEKARSQLRETTGSVKVLVETCGKNKILALGLESEMPVELAMDVVAAYAEDKEVGRLSFNGVELQEGFTLGDYSLPDGAFLKQLRPKKAPMLEELFRA
jgi:hypothetical protein